MMRDDGNRGLPLNEDPALAVEGGAAALMLNNMSNLAKAVPASCLR
jgi:phosphopantothenate synthetase